MKIIDFNRIKEEKLKGMVWAMPTDTIPGLSCLALDQDAIKRMDHIKQRPPEKSYIIMIGSVAQLELFNIVPNQRQQKLLNRVWPGPVSIVIPGLGEEFSHLDGIVEGLAFRLPDNPLLQEFCNIHGPVVTTSANISGQETLRSMDDIMDQFSNIIDFIIIDTLPVGEPSTLIKILR